MSFLDLFKVKNNVTKTSVSIQPYSFSTTKLNDRIFKQSIEDCKTLKTNLVVASYHYCCNEDTAKYRGRVYSITGTDDRFPPLTDDILNCKDLSFSPFIYGETFYVYDKKEDPIRYSNRPFVDDRTDEEKKKFLEITNMQKAEKKDRKDYEWIIKNLPGIAPKSFAGYRKMKNSNSKNFLLILEEAAKLGYHI